MKCLAYLKVLNSLEIFQSGEKELILGIKDKKVTKNKSILHIDNLTLSSAKHNLTVGTTKLNSTEAQGILKLTFYVTRY